MSEPVASHGLRVVDRLLSFRDLVGDTPKANTITGQTGDFMNHLMEAS